jgi:hypothetical protein
MNDIIKEQKKDFLQWLLDGCPFYNVESFCQLINDIEWGYKKLECGKISIEEFEFIEEGLQSFTHELEEIKKDYAKSNIQFKEVFGRERSDKIDKFWDEEIEKVKQYNEKLHRLKV